MTHGSDTAMAPTEAPRSTPASSSSTLAAPPTGRAPVFPGEIVVGVDGSYAAGEALAWAARLARTGRAELTAVHAWQPGLGELSSGADRARRHERADVRRWCRVADDTGAATRSVVVVGEPDRVLAEAARARGDGVPPLLVLGRATHGAGLEHDHDHLCDRVARHLPDVHSPLAVVPSPGAGRSLRRIVLGLHDSPGAAAAAHWVAAVAASTAAEVVAATVFEPIVEWVPRFDRRSVWSALRRELEGGWTEPLRRDRVAFTTRVIEGTNVTASLTQLARDWHADAIVVGLGDVAGWRRHPASGLVERCHLPCIFVPAGTSGTAGP